MSCGCWDTKVRPLLRTGCFASEREWLEGGDGENPTG